jgi:hypothetical protein
MRKLMMFVALIVGLMMAASPVVAQTPAADFSDVDVETVAATALDADLDSLITAMEEPMADEDLPEGFSNAEFVDPETAGEMDLVLPTEDLEFSEGSVAYNLDYEPDTTGMAIGLSSLNYVFVDGEITEDDMDDFSEGASEGLESDTTGADVAVEDIEINGVTGVLISYELEEDGIISIVQMIALPVGNTMVLGMVVAASDDPQLNSGQVLTDAENLILAGVDHLGTVAEDAQ